METHDSDDIRGRLHVQGVAGAIRVTAHAHQEMVNEGISLSQVIDVLLDAMVLEDYPEHQRGACCLICGKTLKGRYIHVERNRFAEGNVERLFCVGL